MGIFTDSLDISSRTEDKKMTRPTPMETNHENYNAFLDSIDRCISLAANLPNTEHYEEHPAFENLVSILDEVFPPFEISATELPPEPTAPKITWEEFKKITPNYSDPNWLDQYEALCAVDDYQLAKLMPKAASYSNHGRASEILRRIFRHDGQLLFNGMTPSQLEELSADNIELNLARDLIGDHKPQDARIGAIRPLIAENVPSVTAWVQKPTEAQETAAAAIASGESFEPAPSVKHSTIQDRWLAQLLEDDVAKINRFITQQWTVRHWMPVQSIGSLIAPSGVGKTFAAVDIGASISLGIPVFGGGELTTGDPGLVVHVAAEGGGGLAVRKRAWELHRGMMAPDFRILSASPMVDDDGNAHILAAVISKLSAIKSKPVRLIVLDTLNRTFGGEENSATDMAAYLRGCERLRDDTGACVLILHHPGHSGNRARGSSGLKAGLDFEWALSEDGGLRLSCEKMKDHDDPTPIELKKIKVVLPGVTSQEGDPVSSLVVDLATLGDQMRAARKLTDREQLMIDLVRKHGTDGVVISDTIRDGFNGSTLMASEPSDTRRQAFRRAIKKLTALGMLTSDGYQLRLIDPID